LRSGNGYRNQIDRCLGEDVAVERGAGLEAGKGLHQKGSLEVRVDPGIDVAGHLPEDVGGQGAAFEDDISPAARDDISAAFEDEHV